ncbi:hypothetical protein L6164_018456 [Bauhinia variegata]|nr:hypothetical protein L6164_018456 [Bauhinia variegata]
MAFTTLTNPKTILNLGPNRSILGTIIRPDAVLLERKGGLNGEVTFNSLLPGAGESLQQYGDQGMLCNWQLDYEEALPRNIDGSKETSKHSSGKKRKAVPSDNSSKKIKQTGDSGTENGTTKKHKRKAFRQ